MNRLNSGNRCSQAPCQQTMTDDQIAAAESAHRNEATAKLLLFQHMGGTEKDRFRLLDAL
jgi:hypothetical protein